MNKKITPIFIVGLALSIRATCLGAGMNNEKAPLASDRPSFVSPPANSISNPSDSLMPPVRHDEPENSTLPADYDAESEEHPLGRGTPGFAILFGGAFVHTGGNWDAGPAAAARYYFPKSSSESEGPESLSPWSVEIGGIFPHQVPGDSGGSITTDIGGTHYEVKIHAFSEEHLAFQYRKAVHWPIRMVPELSLGISLAKFENNIYTQTTSGGLPVFTYSTPDHTAIGPWTNIGLSLLANDWFALRMAVGYVKYSNTVDAPGQSFDLGLSGLAVYPSVQISLGYLHPGVEKGVYLPTSSLPLWALAAVQSGKRSPVIAPPEVALNARQAAQGGLSGNVLFQYKSRSAQKVELLADFNHWKPEPMFMDSAHVWVTVKDLKAGPYHYVYLVNGKREVRDPWNTSFDASQRAHGVSTFVVPEVNPVP